MKLKANLRLNKLSQVGVGGWVGVAGWLAGWLEQLGIKLISTQVVVEVEVELGKKDSEGGKCITQTGFN